MVHVCVLVCLLLVLLGRGDVVHDENGPYITLESYPFVMLEHVNINSGTLWNEVFENFYVHGLGFVHDTRSVGVLDRQRAAGGTTLGLEWCNIGLQQIHLPSDEPQRVIGYIALQYAQLSVVLSRMRAAGVAAEEVIDGEGSLLYVKTICPTGNEFRLYEQGSSTVDNHNHLLVGSEHYHTAQLPDRDLSWLGPAPFIPPDDSYALPGGRSLGLGMSHLNLYIPLGTAGKICAFYNYLFLASAYTSTDPELHTAACIVPMGYGQFLRYSEHPEPQPAYDGHHIAVYVRDFAALYTRAAAHGLNWDNPRFPQFSYGTLQDALRHQEFRVKDIWDLATNETIYVLEHEIRSVEHPSFCCRQLIPAADSPRAVPVQVHPLEQ